jgi:hypothetical protein
MQSMWSRTRLDCRPSPFELQAVTANVVLQVAYCVRAQGRVGMNGDEGVTLFMRPVVLRWPALLGRGAEHPGVLSDGRFQGWEA